MAEVFADAFYWIALANPLDQWHEAVKQYAGGMSEDETLDEFPDLNREDIQACLAFAADRERRLQVSPQSIVEEQTNLIRVRQITKH